MQHDRTLNKTPNRKPFGVINNNIQSSAYIENDFEDEVLSDKELELLLRQLSKMLGAKLSLEKALGIIASGDLDLQRTIVSKELLDQLRQGKNFSEIFADFLTQENIMLASLLKSGEMSGNLAQAVAEMEKLVVSRNKTIHKIQSSMVYPAILSAISFMSLIIILFYVIPQFSSLLDQNQNTLPAAAKVVFWLSDSIREWGWLVFSLFLIVVYKAYNTIRSGGLFNLVNKAFGIMPGFTELPDKIQINMICKLMGTLLSNGVKILNALEVTRDAMSDEAFYEALDEVIDAVKSGASAEIAFSDTDLFPVTFLQMIRIGEESGDLGSMFSRSSDILEEEIDSKIKRFLILFEPLILLGIGLMIGGLLYGLFSAILSVNSVAF